MLLIKSSYASQSQVFSSGSFFLSFLSTGLGFSYGIIGAFICFLP
jgi:hypothetical protein